MDLEFKHRMVRVLRNVTMLLTLLLVVICNMGVVCVCQCHGELFTGSCSCLHQAESPRCACHGCADHAAGQATSPENTPAGTQSAAPAHHECKHVLLTTDEVQAPCFNTTVPEAPTYWVESADFLLMAAFTPDVAVRIPPAPDIPPDARAQHEGYWRPLLI